MCFIISQKVPDSRVVEIPLGSQDGSQKGLQGLRFVSSRGDVMLKVQRGGKLLGQPGCSRHGNMGSQHRSWIQDRHN